MSKLAGKKEEESPDSKMLNTRIPKELIKPIKYYCADTEMTIQNFITEAVKEKLKASGR